MSIEKASARAPLPGQSTAVVYFDIVNHGGEDTLLSATSNVSSRVELHDHIHEDGVMKMRQVNNVAIPAKDRVSFQSGGLHVMLFNVEGDEPYLLTLDFETHEDITIQILPNIN